MWERAQVGRPVAAAAQQFLPLEPSPGIGPEKRAQHRVRYPTQFGHQNHVPFEDVRVFIERKIRGTFSQRGGRPAVAVAEELLPPGIFFEYKGLGIPEGALYTFQRSLVNIRETVTVEDRTDRGRHAGHHDARGTKRADVAGS